VLIEPGNDFFERHINDIVYLRRDFYANGSGGLVSVKIEPGSKSEIATIENGEIYQIQYTYNHNGEIWGVVDIEAPGKPYSEWQRGWVLVGDFLVVYDSLMFETDHKDEIFIYAGDWDALRDIRKLVFWKWPGSGIVSSVVDETTVNEQYLSTVDELVQIIIEMAQFSREGGAFAYTDSEGREWVASMSMIKSWICLSDPSNADIPAFNPAPEPELWQPGDEHSKLPNGFPLPVLIIILVAFAAIVTIVLIRVFWKKNES